MAGRGMGRGRGRPATGPIARDDEGNPYVTTGPVAPPPLFPPPQTLPPLPQLTDLEKHMLLRRRELNSAYRGSCFFIEVPEKEEVVDIQRFTDRFKTRLKTSSSMRPQLTSIMTLTPANFPPELYGKTTKGKNRNLGSLVNANRATEDLLKLDKMLDMERKYAADEEGDEGSTPGRRKGGAERKVDGDEGDGVDEEEEVEEDDYEDDDYNQGYDFDDDEGYDDDDAGGDDDEAVF